MMAVLYQKPIGVTSNIPTVAIVKKRKPGMRVTTSDTKVAVKVTGWINELFPAL